MSPIPTLILTLDVFLLFHPPPKFLLFLSPPRLLLAVAVRSSDGAVGIDFEEGLEEVLNDSADHAAAELGKATVQALLDHGGDELLDKGLHGLVFDLLHSLAELV